MRSYEIPGQMTIFDIIASAPDKKEYAEYLFEIVRLVPLQVIK